MSGDHNQYQKPEVTPEEEEAWQELERKNRQARDRLFIRAQQEAGICAQEFIDHTPKLELGIFTLRKAFEMGFIRGVLFTEQGEK
jgi:hypothetical protein